MTTSAFLLALIAIFASAKLFGELAERIGQPAVLGELVGGAIVGISGLRLVDPNAETIHQLAQLGIVFLLFMIGLNTELEELIRVGGAAVVVAIAGVVITFAGGFAIGRLLHLPYLVAVFLGGSVTATSVGISARVLADLGHLHDREAQVILGAAVVDDIIGVILLSLIGGIAEGSGMSAYTIVRMAVVAFGFVFLAIVIGSWLAPWLVRTIDRLGVARGLFFASFLFALTLAWIAERAGTAIIIGSFAAGLVLARTEKGKEIELQMRNAAHFFVPIFFVAVGAALDVRTLLVPRYLLIGGMLALVAVIGKVIAGFLAPGRDLRRVVIGIGMIPRGEVSLIFAQVGLAGGLLSAGLFSSITIMVVVTAFLTPLLLRALLPRDELAAEAGEENLVMDAPMDDERRRADRAATHV